MGEYTRYGGFKDILLIYYEIVDKRSAAVLIDFYPHLRMLVPGIIYNHAYFMQMYESFLLLLTAVIHTCMSRDCRIHLNSSYSTYTACSLLVVDVSAQRLTDLRSQTCKSFLYPLTTRAL